MSNLSAEEVEAYCPNKCTNRDGDLLKTFVTTAHVAQEWIVNAQGHWEETKDDCTDVTYGPDIGNDWTCTECGETAKFRGSITSHRKILTD